EKILFITALASVTVIFFIILTIFRDGLLLFKDISVSDFLFGMTWSPIRGDFGIFPMIVGTIVTTIGSMVISVPIGILCAVFLAEVAPNAIRGVLRPTIELLAGIPSVIYGFIGLRVLVPFIREYLGPPGESILAGSIVLAIMALPAIITISEDAIKSVPKIYKDTSLALGATHWQTIKKVMLPTASSGILAGVVLGTGRAIGETMAVIMVIGNLPFIPNDVLDPVRTLTANIALEFGYAPAGPHRQALFATGIVLFIMIFILIIGADMIRKGQEVK
ncbi:MAG: phosphate ABC transporter permease subunit PstC, partial [Methanosarcinaceae archaeon]|nr:phosphate ABC transporter permease subunit PstC [Methanosarcinaceae archaeon]